MRYILLAGVEGVRGDMVGLQAKPVADDHAEDVEEEFNGDELAAGGVRSSLGRLEGYQQVSSESGERGENIPRREQ